MDRARSTERIAHDIETLSGPDYTLSDRGDPALRLHPGVPQHARLVHARARGDRLHGRGGSGRDALCPQPAEGRAGVRNRLALRLQPQRRPLRRDDGRRHCPGGLPPQRRGRARPAAPADLVPGGGGLRLRPDAARQQDRRAAGRRGGSPRALPLDRRRPQLLGPRCRCRLPAGAVARVRARARRPDRVDRDAHRAGARAPGHRQPDRPGHRDRRLRPRRRGRPRPRRPRRGDADGPPARPDAPSRRDDRRARAARAGRRPGNGRHGRRDRGRPGADQRRRSPGALLARHPRARRRRVPRRGERDRRLRRGGRPTAAE